MIIDYYKFKKDREASNNFILSSANSQSDRIPPDRIKFVSVKDKTSGNSKFRLVFNKETIAHLIFPHKNKGIGYFENGDDLILVRWLPQISRLHIIIIHDKRMYAEMLYQMFIQGLIDFYHKPANPDTNVQ